MKKSILLILTMLLSATAIKASDSKVTILYTTDVHGCFFPVNQITGQLADGCLAKVATVVDSIRADNAAGSVVLLDNGDVLQGQPAVYYYNYINTTATHIAAGIYNFMGYDAVTIGNHDVETGHSVYDRWRDELSMPLLGANVVDKSTGAPYLTPYVVFERGGLKIAVLGLLTPAIPAWLPENLWHGLEFRDMIETAQEWVPKIISEEKPDVLIGLFHSGHDLAKRTGDYMENASLEVARRVDGFDAILMGHDHQRWLEPVISPNGRQVWVLNPANNAQAIGRITISVGVDSVKSITADLIDVTQAQPSAAFMDAFADAFAASEAFVGREIGIVRDTLRSNDAIFGPSKFMTLLHDLQLQISGADISLAAPLAFGGVIEKGPLTVADMFTLYKYENMLYTIELTGCEIKGYLEESYGQWTNQITTDQNHIIKFADSNPDRQNNRLANPVYNFDSASGINYTVDVTKPYGEKVKVQSMSDGTPFSLDKKYRVAVNSYRGNGGGNHLTRGAGISPECLPQRIISSTDKDLRYYLIKTIESNPDVDLRVDNNWRFVPEHIAAKAVALDREILFSPDSAKSQK